MDSSDRTSCSNLEALEALASATSVPGSSNSDAYDSLSTGRLQNELVRLILQAQTYQPLTRRFLVEAGIRRGMRVMDLGCGPGDVSFLVSEIVGPTGAVLGVERSAHTVAVAIERARRSSKQNVSFVCADVETLDLADDFDALVGRFILRELRDAAQSIRGLSRFLIPNGVVAFQEKILAIPIASFPSVDLVEQVRQWMDGTRRKAGVDISTGSRLPEIFQEAGLPPPRLRLDAPVGYGHDWSGYEYITETLRGMMPLMRLYGIAGDLEIDIESLASRLRDEVVTRGSIVTLTPCIGAWTGTADEA